MQQCGVLQCAIVLSLWQSVVAPSLIWGAAAHGLATAALKAGAQASVRDSKNAITARGENIESKSFPSRIILPSDLNFKQRLAVVRRTHYSSGPVLMAHAAAARMNRAAAISNVIDAPSFAAPAL